MSNDVITPRKEYTQMLPFTQKNRAAVAGQRVVRAGGTTFLEPLASMLCETTIVNDVQTINYSSQLTVQGQAKYNRLYKHRDRRTLHDRPHYGGY